MIRIATLLGLFDPRLDMVFCSEVSSGPQFHDWLLCSSAAVEAAKSLQYDLSLLHLSGLASPVLCPDRHNGSDGRSVHPA
jgi:hypothetical protein